MNKSLFTLIYCSAVITTIALSSLMMSGCSTVPPEQEGSSIPWAQPEEWENNQMKTGVGF